MGRFGGANPGFGDRIDAAYRLRADEAARARLGGGYRLETAFGYGDRALGDQDLAGVGYALSHNLGIQLNKRNLAESGADLGDDGSFVRSQFDSVGATIGLVWSK